MRGSELAALVEHFVLQIGHCLHCMLHVLSEQIFRHLKRTHSTSIKKRLQLCLSMGNEYAKFQNKFFNLKKKKIRIGQIVKKIHCCCSTEKQLSFKQSGNSLLATCCHLTFKKSLAEQNHTLRVAFFIRCFLIVHLSL